MNKKSKIIIGILIAIILVLVTVIVVGIILSTNKAIEERKKEEISKYTAREVVEYLEEQGYEFENMESTVGTYTTKYVYVSNKDNGIIFQKFVNPLIGSNYSWKNNDINSEWADIRSTYENDKLEEKRQYWAYEKWLEYEGLTSKQITDALDYHGNYGGEYEKFNSLLNT